MTTVLIDSDIVAFRNAAASEGDPLEIALLRTDKMMRDIIEDTGANSYYAFLSGSNNFRKEIYPEYKANRKDIVKPIHLAACKDFLVREWNAVTSEGCEADDLLGCHQTNDTIIASIDKDLLMIPGQHYNFVKKEWSVISPLLGLHNFYRSALVGDKADNIIGVRGIGPVKAAALIDHLEDEKDMYNTVCKLYNDPCRLDMNLDCLWIWQETDVRWSDRFPF